MVGTWQARRVTLTAPIKCQAGVPGRGQDDAGGRSRMRRAYLVANLDLPRQTKTQSTHYCRPHNPPYPTYSSHYFQVLVLPPSSFVPAYSLLLFIAFHSAYHHRSPSTYDGWNYSTSRGRRGERTMLARKSAIMNSFQNPSR